MSLMTKNPQARTRAKIEAMIEILGEHHPMTVRQVYYQLVSRQVVENSRTGYQSVSDALVTARKRDLVPWEWIEDRLRRPRHVSMWADLADFAVTVRRAYRRNVWEEQHTYVEVWLEKDALSGIFEDALEPYGVTLNVGRGFDGWSSIYGAAQRYQGVGCPVAVLYFGDFDPSGEDMVRSLRERLGELGASPEIIKCTLTEEDVARYKLPPDRTKRSDTRSAAFVARYGDVSVELDALPTDTLRARLVAEVEARMNLDALADTRVLELADRVKLEALLR